MMGFLEGAEEVHDFVGHGGGEMSVDLGGLHPLELFEIPTRDCFSGNYPTMVVQTNDADFFAG